MANSSYVIFSDRILEGGNRQIVVTLPDLRRVTLRIPAARNSPDLVTEAIEAMVATHRQPGGAR